MRKLKVTGSAEEDLAEIWAFIAQDNPKHAAVFIETLQEKFAPLLSHPEMGSRRDSLAPDLRAHFCRDYVIYYMISDTEIIIVRVLHGSRDAKAIFSGGDTE